MTVLAVLEAELHLPLEQLMEEARQPLPGPWPPPWEPNPERIDTPRLNRGPRLTHCCHGHELTADNLKMRSDGGRECLTCARAQQAVYQRRRRAPGVAARRMGKAIRAWEQVVEAERRRELVAARRAARARAEAERRAEVERRAAHRRAKAAEGREAVTRRREVRRVRTAFGWNAHRPPSSAPKPGFTQVPTRFDDPTFHDASRLHTPDLREAVKRAPIVPAGWEERVADGELLLVLDDDLPRFVARRVAA